MHLRREFGERLPPSVRAALISGAATGVALLLIGWSLMQARTISVAVCAFVAIVCAVVISRLPLQFVGVILIGLFCFTASWDQTGIGGTSIRQLFLVLGGILLAIGLDLRRFPPVPWWLHAYAASAVVVTGLQAAFPIAQSYLTGRYATSATGQDLGQRGGSLPSLLSLLFNTYVASIVIVVACMYLPRALRWLIGAYVAGAALSCAAGIMGYYGQPWLVNLFGGLPFPVGFRAAGFTSHSLRLATSGVMAMGLACWLTLQPQWILKWCGRLSVPILVVGLYVSGSRGGIVAGMLVLVLSTFMLPDVRRRIHIVVSVAGAMLLGLYLLVPAQAAGILDATRIFGGRTASLSDLGRAEVLDQGTQDFHTSPVFGIGVQFLAEAHTLYVGVLAGGGIIMAAGYFLFSVGSIRTNLQALKVDRSLGGALLATVIASLWYWTVADLFQIKSVAIIYGFIIALWWQGESGKSTAIKSPELIGNRYMKAR